MTPTNDPANDRYNPPGLGSSDFERLKFEEVGVDDLFWQSDLPGNNIPWRKVSETQAINIKAQTTHNFRLNTIVWQKI